MGLMQAYNAITPTLSVKGPTYFCTTIELASKIAAPHHQARTNIKGYLVLLIITDGEISDMGNTFEALSKACQLPMSIVIVGVGKANFSNMESLDGDEGGQKLQNDIV